MEEFEAMIQKLIVSYTNRFWPSLFFGNRQMNMDTNLELDIIMKYVEYLESKQNWAKCITFYLQILVLRQDNPKGRGIWVEKLMKAKDQLTGNLSIKAEAKTNTTFRVDVYIPPGETHFLESAKVHLDLHIAAPLNALTQSVIIKLNEEALSTVLPITPQSRLA
jgi:hypothetical protein